MAPVEKVPCPDRVTGARVPRVPRRPPRDPGLRALPGGEMGARAGDKRQGPPLFFPACQGALLVSPGRGR